MIINKLYPYSAGNLDLFRQKITAARRQTGRLQRELAHTLGINPQVLSRKLHGIKQTFLTHTEVKQIIKTLADWDGITTQAEAIELLSLMGLKAESFSDQEWHIPPLNRLESVDSTTTLHTASPHTLQAITSSLPAASTALLGRAQYVQMLLDRLQQGSIRLLTLLGTGGIGKTRLALEVAHIARCKFAHGVFFVSLAALRDEAIIPSTIIEVLPLTRPIIETEVGLQNISSQKDILKTFLHDKELLLVLDNVEHLSTIASFISDLLSSAPALKIMVTSRMVLHLYGEQECDVPPLEFGLPNQPIDLQTISQLSAIRLFIERAQALNPAFQMTEQNATMINHICARLDGLPLAIELAAARTKVLSLPAILQRLTEGTGQSLAFLHSNAHNILQRHQTLQETLDWSYELLTLQQQHFFYRLSVFVGGWTAQAALATIGTEEDQIATLDDVLEQMEALIDHSLVKRALSATELREENLEARFYFLETIHEYALSRLGADEDIQRRHATYYLDLAESVAPDLAGHKQVAATALLIREQDNLRAALTWALERNETTIVQRMCGALSKFWEARAQFQEAHIWIDAALKMTQETSPRVRAKLLMAASRLSLWEVTYERSRELAQEALPLYEAIDDMEGKALAIFQIGDTWHMQGEYALATSYLEESLHLLHAQKNWGNYAFTLSRLGAMAILQGNFSQAWTLLQDALPLMRTYSEPGLLNVNLVYLGTLALVQGDLAKSMTYLREGLLLAQHIHNHYMLATTLIVSGCLLGTSLEPSYAAHICSAAEALFTSLNTSLPNAYQPLYNAYLGGLQSQVDEALWQTWWAEGKALSVQEVGTLVLEASLSE